MNKKHTIEVCQEFAKSKGGECLSNEYVNGVSHLKWKCSLGHEWNANFFNIKNGGKWCPKCARVKYSLQDCQDLAKNLGGKCLSKEYVNTCKLMEWEDKDKNIFISSFIDLKNREHFCQAKKINKYNLPHCQEFAKSKGGECLSKEYVNGNTKMRWKCSKGHEWNAGFFNINNGTWCPKCAGNKKYNIRDCQEFAKSKGGECLSKKYINANEKMIWRCSKGHTWKTSFYGIRSGSWCNKCVAKKLKLTLIHCQEFAKSKGGECLSNEYNTNSTIMSWKCSEGHIWKTGFKSLRNEGTWCPTCAKTNPKTEHKIEEFLKEHKITYEKNYRDIKELDFYLLDYKLGIECNGVYWHSTKKKDKNYHKEKQEHFNKLGIQTLFFWEDEINTKLDIIKSMILAKIKNSPIKIFARKCEIKEVSFVDSKKFLNENHLQGNCMSKFRVGLYYGEELVSLMTFGAVRSGISKRKTEDIKYELIRFCAKQNISVVGGASKLFKHFINKFNEGIVSYSANDYSDGGLYKNLGFILEKENKPNYYYRTSLKNYHRSNFQRKNIKVKFPKIYSENLTEEQMMNKTQLNRCYNSGTKTFIYPKVI